MASGAAQTTLETLQEILDELSQTVTQHEQGYSDAGKKILVNIKNTMSDRASSQKAFNTLLSEYRSEILPQVLHNWDSFSVEEQQSMSQMYNFYCGMHLVVNMAETVSEALKLFEMASMEDKQASDSESGTIRLVRTTCKAFEKRGNEKSGYPLQFNTYLNTHGIERNPLIHFRGNRFNIIFANGGRVYYLHQHIVNFLTNVLGTPNRLLKSVLEDVSNDLYVAGCKALGLISKHITAPLWRILESKIHILDLPKYYERLLTFVQNCEDPSGFMTGEDVPFPEIAISKDQVWIALVTPSTTHDQLARQIILSCFKSIYVILSRVISDQKPAVTTAKRSETISVNKTNTISERDFAKLDRLIREKPHATMLSLEAHILFSNNKTMDWLDSKSPDEVKTLMETARKLVPKHKERFRERLAAIEAYRLEMQKKNQEDKIAAMQRLLLEKERITSDMIKYGLWQSESDVNEGLQLAKTETQKRQSLKAQLRFRKTVLQQHAPASDKDIFKFSTKSKGQLNSKALRENLLKLINEAAAVECSSLPVHGGAENPINLVGKCIDHQFKEDGQLVTYSGKVVSTVPGFPEWFNVVYNNEPDVVYSYKLLEDFGNGDLKIL